MEFKLTAPQRVYLHKRVSAQQELEAGAYDLPIPIGLAKTKTGGMATIFPGHPFPRKGFVYGDVTKPNNKAKRITLSIFMPFASLINGPKAFLNSYFLNYNRLIDSFYSDIDQVPYLHYEYYSEFGKNIWDFIYFFLKRLGVKDGVAYKTGLQIATIFEYDDAYRVRAHDLLNESSREALLENPYKEIARLTELFKQREPNFTENENEGEVGTKFVKIAKFFKLIPYIPFVRNAYRFALQNINYENFYYDESDYYWTLNRGDYNCNGENFEQRKRKGIAMMVEFAKKVNPDKDVRVEEENGQTLIKTYDKTEITS